MLISIFQYDNKTDTSDENYVNKTMIQNANLTDVQKRLAANAFHTCLVNDLILTRDFYRYFNIYEESELTGINKI